MKSQLNRQLIESLSESGNIKFLERVNDTVYGLVSQVLTDISERSPFVRVDKCVLIPVNEVYLGTFSQLSTYDYFLGVENPQIEFNSKLKKNFWKFAWREFKASWRLGKKKYKKRKKEKEKIPSLEEVEKYKISDFRHDVVQGLSNYLTQTSIIYEHSRHIAIVGKDDFGTNVKIQIFICAYDSSDDTFKMFKDSKNKFVPVNFGNRFSNLDYKVGACGDSFVQMVRIFNALFSKAYNKIPNQILVESLVWNCPNLLFDGKDIFKTFVNVANYIRLADPKSIVSICDTSKSIFEEKLIVDGGLSMEFSKVINMLDKFEY